MEDYLIEKDATEGYQVRCIANAAHASEVVARFASYEQAQTWVEEQRRIAIQSANASDVA